MSFNVALYLVLVALLKYKDFNHIIINDVQ